MYNKENSRVVNSIKGWTLPPNNIPKKNASLGVKHVGVFSINSINSVNGIEYVKDEEILIGNNSLSIFHDSTTKSYGYGGDMAKGSIALHVPGSYDRINDENSTVIEGCRASKILSGYYDKKLSAHRDLRTSGGSFLFVRELTDESNKKSGKSSGQKCSDDIEGFLKALRTSGFAGNVVYRSDEGKLLSSEPFYWSDVLQKTHFSGGKNKLSVSDLFSAIRIYNEFHNDKKSSDIKCSNIILPQAMGKLYSELEKGIEIAKMSGKSREKEEELDEFINRISSLVCGGFSNKELEKDKPLYNLLLNLKPVGEKIIIKAQEKYENKKQELEQVKKLEESPGYQEREKGIKFLTKILGDKELKLSNDDKSLLQVQMD
ncbi:MAG: hypothetical protein LBC92_05305, partial [Rickettsiales bacterium]|nr:hypothetical protein [Rickettsiales bacterium]